MANQPEWEANKKRTAAFFGISTQGLDGWIARDCPVVKVGNKLTFYLPDVVAWKLGRVSGEAGSLEAERRRLTKEQADKTELENHRLRGDLLPADDVFTVWSKFIIDVRTRLLAIPSKLAPELVNLKRKTDAKNLLETELYQALDDFTEINCSAYLAKGSGTVQIPAKADGKPVGRRRAKAKPRVKRGTRPVEN